MLPREADEATATHRLSCADQLAKLDKGCTETADSLYLHCPDRRECGAQPLKGAMPRKQLPP